LKQCVDEFIVWLWNPGGNPHLYLLAHR
jgi:hypothetical protein